MAVDGEEVAERLAHGGVGFSGGLEEADDELLKQVFVRDDGGEHQLAEGGGGSGLDVRGMRCFEAFGEDFEDGFGEVGVRGLGE